MELYKSPQEYRAQAEDLARQRENQELIDAGSTIEAARAERDARTRGAKARLARAGADAEREALLQRAVAPRAVAPAAAPLRLESDQPEARAARSERFADLDYRTKVSGIGNALAAEITPAFPEDSLLGGMDQTLLYLQQEGFGPLTRALPRSWAGVSKRIFGGIPRGTSVMIPPAGAAPSKAEPAPRDKNATGRSYTVRPGDDLYSIAIRYGVSPTKIRALNKSKFAGTVEVTPGSVVELPPEVD